jgi:hypothetical protein
MIPGEHHLARHCGGSKLREDGMPAAAAFSLRDGEDYLSVNWLEITGRDTADEQIACVRGHLVAKGRKIGASSKFAVFMNASLATHIRSETSNLFNLTAIYKPELPHDPSHSGVHGYSHEDALVEQLISEFEHFQIFDNA